MPNRATAPVPGPTAQPHFPAFDHSQTESGMGVYAMTRRHTPLVTLRLILPAGGHHDPVDRPGLAAFTAALLEEGTQARGSEEIADLIESLGGSLATGAGWNSAAISVACLAEHYDIGMELLAEIATTPAFSDGELERLRRERLAEWLRRRDQPGALAEEALAATLYAGTPYDHPLLGDRDALETIDREQIASFWSDRADLSKARLLAVGDIETEAVLGTARSWNALARPNAETPPVPGISPPPAKRRVVVVDRPSGAQTELRVGHVGPPRSHPDRTVLQVANSLLGGKFTSRINLNLRERNGYTYGAHSSFVDRQGPGPFLVWTAVANDVAGKATREILIELERMRSEDVTPVELEETLAYLTGVFPYSLQTLGGTLHRLQELAVYDLADDHIDRQLEKLRAVTASDIRTAAQAHIEPDLATIVAVGPADELCPQLDDLGPLEVVPAFDPAA